MKKIWIAIFCIIALAIITKPSDQSCLDQIKDKLNTQIANSNPTGFRTAMQELGADVGSRYMYRIEDNILFKSIYLKGSNSIIAIGCFGMVIGTH